MSYQTAWEMKHKLIETIEMRERKRHLFSSSALSIHAGSRGCSGSMTYSSARSTRCRPAHSIRHAAASWELLSHTVPEIERPVPAGADTQLQETADCTQSEEVCQTMNGSSAT